MTNRSDRTWDAPSSPWVMRMKWSQLLFAHWPIDPKLVSPLLPKDLTLDTYDGVAWIGVVPFLMSDIAPRCFPAVPPFSQFLELNVRTYVTYNDKPGVWFFSLDAANRIAVRAARAVFHLPYMDAKMSLQRDDKQQITFRSQRTHRGEPRADLDVSYRAVGETFEAERGTLEHWLTARYCLYSANRQGAMFRGEIDHPPWELSNAEWTERHNSMCKPLGIELTSSPHLLFAQPIRVHAWMAARCN